MTNRQLRKRVSIRPRQTQTAHLYFNTSFSAFILRGYGVLFFLLFFLGISATSSIGQCVTSPVTTNNGLHFNGTTDYVTINSCSNGNIFPGGHAITIEYWFKGSNLQSAVMMQGSDFNIAVNHSYILSGWNGKHILSNEIGFSGEQGLQVGAGYNDGNWHHIAMTWQYGTVNGFKSYLDGVLVDQRNSSVLALDGFSTGVYLGAFNRTSDFMNGILDEVRVWTVARTQAQIQASACALQDQMGLLMYYKFNHGAANSANAGITGLLNSASNDLHGVLSNFDLTTQTNWVTGAPIFNSKIQSSGGNLCNGATHTLTADAYGCIAGFTFNWQYKAAGASNYTDIGTPIPYSVGDHPTYTTPPLSTTNNGTMYRGMFTSINGTFPTDPLTFTLSLPPSRLYVKANATGGNSGLDWTNAFTDLQLALQYTCSSALTEIWVAKGTYKPSNVYDQNASFVMLPNVKIYGSFAGTEANLSERTAAVRAANVSILSGDLDDNDNPNGNLQSNTFNFGNSYNVISNISNGLTNANALLDGFTISGGNTQDVSAGGGMLNANSSPSINNVTFTRNFGRNGGGLFNNASSPSLSNVSFLNNVAGFAGGGISNVGGSTPSLNNVTFSSNIASDGGGMSNDNASPNLSNVIFQDNRAGLGSGMYNANAANPSLSNVIFSGNGVTYSPYISTNGGGMYNNASSPILNNVTFWHNGSTNGGGGMYNLSSAPTIKSSIFSGNYNLQIISSIDGYAANVTYSDIEQTSGVYAGTGNINQDPLFVNTANPAGADGIFGTADDGLALAACSPALNAGDNTGVATTDIVGNPRIFGGTVDMGAYELQAASHYYTTSPTTTNNALNFDGTNDYVEINNCSNTSPISNTDALTIEYWFKGTSNQSAVRIQDNGGWIVAGWNGLHILSNDGGLTGISVGSGYTDGNWHHVAMTWQRNTTNGFKSYLDGQLVAQRNSSDNPLPIINTGLSLGSLSGLSEFTNGSMDEVRLWNVVRSQAQIQAAMSNFNLTVPQTGLKWYYQFNHGQANSANPTIMTLINSADPTNYIGALHNFALNGAASNWVSTYSMPSSVSLTLKAILQGPYNSTTGLMNDALRSLASFPLTSPYGTGETIASSVLTVTGNTAVVDWVKVELRDKTTAANILKTRSGLLLANGNIVDIDGSSPLSFSNTASDNYYVALIHRNHLGVRTQNSVALSGTTMIVDFTSPATALYGNILTGTVNLIYSGDIDGTGLIDATDRSGTWNNRNQTGYLKYDCNMNGTVDASDRAFTWNNRNKTNQ